mmetsp:Transcript_24074/g.73716  ORF Transcript_24074/g.73716 Transcript_24074/m.73716 type:complete len:208 (+) Transcript_24074:903-1526(+)
MTKGAVLKSAPAAHVDLSTRVPIGRVSAVQSLRPSGEPVASTTTSNFLSCEGDAWTESMNVRESAEGIFVSRSGCRPTRAGMGHLFDDANLATTSAISSPSLPSPTIATASPGEISPCSTIRQAAARGSVNAAFSVEMWSGTTCSSATGSVRYEAYVPSLPKMPSTVRFGQWLRARSPPREHVEHVALQQARLMSPTTRLPTICSCA